MMKHLINLNATGRRSQPPHAVNPQPLSPLSSSAQEFTSKCQGSGCLNSPLGESIYILPGRVCRTYWSSHTVESGYRSGSGGAFTTYHSSIGIASVSLSLGFLVFLTLYCRDSMRTAFPAWNGLVARFLKNATMRLQNHASALRWVNMTDPCLVISLRKKSNDMTLQDMTYIKTYEWVSG